MSEAFKLQSVKELGDGDMVLHCENMADLMEVHPAYKDQNLLACIPGPEKMREHAQQIKAASAAAKHDPAKEPELQAVRERALQSIRFSCQYVVMYSTHVNDPSLLDNIGVERVHKTIRNMVIKTPVRFKSLTVTHGEDSGSAKIHVNSWEGKGSVEVQVCYDTPSHEESWPISKIFHKCRCTLTGLQPTRRAFFRVRLLNDAGIGPWSEIVELIII